MLHSDHFGDDLRAAVEAIKQGDTDRARLLIDHLLMGDPQNADAWYLESFVAETIEARVRALGRALAANPLHEGAHRRLYSLQQPNAPAGSSSTNIDAAELARREAEAVKALSLDDLLHGSTSNTFVVEDAPPSSDMPKRDSTHETGQNTVPKRKRSSNTPRWGVLLAVAAFVTIGAPLVAVAAATVLPSDNPIPPPITSTPLPSPFPTPAALYDGFRWDWSQPLALREELHGYPAGTQVWLISMSFGTAGWVYETRLDGGYGGVLYVPEAYLASPDEVRAQGTPMPNFPTYTAGVDLITMQPVGDIPAHTPVQVLRARFDGYQWVYIITTSSGHQVEEAPESALAFAR